MKNFFGSMVIFLVAFATVLFTPTPASAQDQAVDVTTLSLLPFLRNQVLGAGQSITAGSILTVKNGPEGEAVPGGVVPVCKLTNAVSVTRPVNCSAITLDENEGNRLCIGGGVGRAALREQCWTFTVTGGKEPATLPVVAAEKAKIADLEKRLNDAGLPSLAKDVHTLMDDLNARRTNVLDTAKKRRIYEEALNVRLAAIEKRQGEQSVAVEAAATTANQALNTANSAVNAAANAQSTADKADKKAAEAKATADGAVVKASDARDRLDLLLPPTAKDSHPGLVLGARGAFYSGLGATVAGTIGGRIPVGNASGWWVACQVGVGAGEKPAQGFGSLVLQTEAGFEYYPLRLIGFGGGVTHSSWFAGLDAHGVGGVVKILIQPHPNVRLVAEGGVINLFSLPAVLDAPKNAPFVGGGLQFTW